MFNFLKSQEKINFLKGLAYGLGAALVVLVVVLVIVFAGPFKENISSENQAGSEDIPEVRTTIITLKECRNCWDVELAVNSLTEGKFIKETARETVYYEDPAGAKLVEKYQIKELPTLLLAGDLEDEKLSQLLASGEIIDEVFVLRDVIPPYFKVASGEFEGIVSAIFLKDDSCQECYPVADHELALNNLYVTPKEIKTVDISSDQGREFLERYQIKYVPTFILQGDLEEYQLFSQIWPEIGRIAEDGSYIFTKVDLMGTYKDLEKDKVIVPEPNGSQADGLETGE